MKIIITEGQYKVIKESFNNEIYYHGTTLPKSNPNIEKFKETLGYRSMPMAGIVSEVTSPWVFFTDNYELAYKYGSIKTDELHHSKGDFTYGSTVLKYKIDISKLNILDLTQDDFESKLYDIGIDLDKLYGYGNYHQESMWGLLDEKETSDLIVNSGFDGVKLIEDIGSHNGMSLAVYMNKVNDSIELLKVFPKYDYNEGK
jgi:hypothetical protein